MFLNSEQAVTTQDIEALDVETIEVIKGAAAAALYGSRAAGGVISITTARGSNLALGQTQFTVRTEAGQDFITKGLEKPLAHQFLVNAQGQYIDSTGSVVPRALRVVQPSGIMENAYIDPTYDHVKQFFRPGNFNTQTVTLQQNSAATNFTLSYTRNITPGVIEGSNGYNRQSMRLNVDHRIKEKLNVGISVSHTRATEDPARVSFTELLPPEPGREPAGARFARALQVRAHPGPAVRRDQPVLHAGLPAEHHPARAHAAQPEQLVPPHALAVVRRLPLV